MLREVASSVLTGAIAGVLFELFANEVPHAALLNAFVLHVWVVVSGVLSFAFYRYIFYPNIPLKWNLAVVVLAFAFLHFKSQAMERLPMPVYIVCSNTKVIVSALLDYFVFSKPSISAGQIFGIFCVTCGCVLITLQSDNFTDGKGYDIEYNIPLGLVYAFLSVFTVSLLLPVSNIAVTNHSGGTFDEMSFMQNILALPLFYPQAEKIHRGVSVLKTSSNVFFIPLPLSRLMRSKYQSMFCNSGLMKIFDVGNGYCTSDTVDLFSIPCGFIFMICTMILTPIHRKQISHVSIKANNSVIGQLVVCAVKTLVLLSLFVILNANSVQPNIPGQFSTYAVPGSCGVKSDYSLYCIMFTQIHASLMAMSRMIQFIYGSFASSMTPQVFWGVILQTVGSVGYILSSSSAPCDKNMSKTLGSSDGSQKTTNDSEAHSESYDDLNACSYSSDEFESYDIDEEIEKISPPFMRHSAINKNVLDFLNEPAIEFAEKRKSPIKRRRKSSIK